MQTKFRFAALVLGAAVVSTGCASSDSQEQAGANFARPAAAATKSMHEGAGAQASVEEVEPILATLNGVQASVRRNILARQAFVPEDEARLATIFAEPARTFQTDLYRYDLLADGYLFKPNPGGARFVDVSLVEKHDDCVRIRASIDERANLMEPGTELYPHDIVLTKQPHDRSINPTPWMIAQYVPTHFAVVDDCYDRSDDIDL